ISIPAGPPHWRTRVSADCRPGTRGRGFWSAYGRRSAAYGAPARGRSVHHSQHCGSRLSRACARWIAVDPPGPRNLYQLAAATRREGGARAPAGPDRGRLGGAGRGGRFYCRGSDRAVARTGRRAGSQEMNAMRRIGTTPVNGVAVTTLLVSVATGAALSASIHRPWPAIAGTVAGLYLVFAIKVVRQWEKV